MIYLALIFLLAAIAEPIKDDAGFIITLILSVLALLAWSYSV